MKAWLITWEWANDAAAVADRVVGILNFRWGDGRVADIVEFLYSNSNASVDELAYYAKKRSNNPYRADIRHGRILCGHNPFLYARVVSDLKIDITDDGRETISWKEPPVYDLVNGKIEKVKEPIPDQFTRRIRGPVSHKIIWDRIKSKFIDGWGPGEIPEECD